VEALNGRLRFDPQTREVFISGAGDGLASRGEGYAVPVAGEERTSLANKQRGMEWERLNREVRMNRPRRDTL